MKITRDFKSTDRYIYDFKYCTTAKGWAQIDTSQDASYYGEWANPFKLKIFCYCEGDLILTECDTPEEFVQELQKIKDFTEGQGYRFLGIDPGFNEKLKTEFIKIGAKDFFHAPITI